MTAWGSGGKGVRMWGRWGEAQITGIFTLFMGYLIILI